MDETIKWEELQRISQQAARVGVNAGTTAEAFRRVAEISIPTKDTTFAEKTQLSGEGTTSDTISRKLAIDAVNKNRDSVFHDSVHYEDVLYDISNLPSAQPEMVKCKQCRHMYYDKEFDNYWCDRMSDPFKVEADGYCKWGK